MDAIVPKETRFLPALANAIADWFPQLDRRSLAVSDVTISKENIPTLPLAMCAFVRSQIAEGTQSKSRVEEFTLIDTFVIEFWLEPERYKRANGSETPFWSYYPYDNIRDTLLNNIVRWEAPNGERLLYRRLTITADALAVALTFEFSATFRWCLDKKEHGEPFTVGWNLCIPPACMPEPVCVEPWLDPCAPSK